MEQQKKPIVHLHLYKGSEVIYNASGKCINENQPYNEKYYSSSFKNFLTVINQYCKVDVVGITNSKGEKWQDESLIDIVKKDIREAQANVNAKALTPDQKRIAELEAKLNTLIEEKQPIEKVKETPVVDVKPEVEVEVEVKQVENNINDEEEKLKEAKAKYKELYGKEPHRLMKLGTLLAKIAEKQ